jgi:hypothetical protein
MQPDRQAGRNDSNRVVAQASDGEAAKPVPQGLSEMKKADVPLESVR